MSVLDVCVLADSYVGLYVIAFTTYKFVSPAGPIVGSIPFGAGSFFVFTSSFTYIVSTYRPIAASAMASNTVCYQALMSTQHGVES